VHERNIIRIINHFNLSGGMTQSTIAEVIIEDQQLNKGEIMLSEVNFEK